MGDLSGIDGVRECIEVAIREQKGANVGGRRAGRRKLSQV